MYGSRSTVDCVGMHHEKQARSMCGMHAFNAAAGFCVADRSCFFRAACAVDDAQRHVVDGGDIRGWRASAQGGSFTIDVLHLVARSCGYTLDFVQPPDRINALTKEGRFVIAQPGHWRAIRSTGVAIVDICSLKPGPVPAAPELVVRLLGDGAWPMLAMRKAVWCGRS